MIPRDLERSPNHLWQSTLFAAVAGLLTLALQHNRAHICYCPWLSASIKFLISFSLLVMMGSHFRAALRAGCGVFYSSCRHRADHAAVYGSGAGLPAGADFQADPLAPTFEEALRDQLGIKLQSQKAPVSVLVVDHVEHPSGN
jgi:hypothetical protein